MFSLLKNAAGAAAKKATNAARGAANVAGQSSRFADLEAAAKTALGVQSSPRPGSAAAVAAQQKANANARQAAAAVAARQQANANAAAARQQANANAAAARQRKANANAAVARQQANANAAARLRAAEEEVYIKEHSDKLLPSEKKYRNDYAAYENLSKSLMYDSSPPDEPPSYESFPEKSLYKEIVKRVEDSEHYKTVLARENKRIAEAEARRAANPRPSNTTNHTNFLSKTIEGRGGRRTRRKRHMKRKQHRTRRHR
jgi:multidrug efflux pump subunit AcrA (membrane-fusion protein)